MKLGKVRTPQGETRIAIVGEEHVRPLKTDRRPGVDSLSDVLFDDDPAALVQELAGEEEWPVGDVSFLAPVDRQEVWAAGVTYKRSQVARMEESEAGASHYDKVYTAPRPELFFKGTAARIVHPGDPVRVRVDSEWSVPEPEFTIVLNPAMNIVGYTIGNDMSARDIEGENPLYLPQAKVYKQCCSIGPSILLADAPLDLDATRIVLRINREGTVVFEGETGLDQLHRKLTELAEWLGKENEFPEGAMLLTGTGIVPDDSFTLLDGDRVDIDVTGIGTLSNPVVKGS